MLPVSGVSADCWLVTKARINTPGEAVRTDSRSTLLCRSSSVTSATVSVFSSWLDYPPITMMEVDIPRNDLNSEIIIRTNDKTVSSVIQQESIAQGERLTLSRVSYFDINGYKRYDLWIQLFHESDDFFWYIENVRFFLCSWLLWQFLNHFFVISRMSYFFFDSDGLFENVWIVLFCT